MQKEKEIAIEKEHTVKLILNGEAKIVAEATINKVCSLQIRRRIWSNFTI